MAARDEGSDARQQGRLNDSRTPDFDSNDFDRPRASSCSAEHSADRSLRGIPILTRGKFRWRWDSAANTNGWSASATLKLHKHVGVSADFSGNYRSEGILNSQQRSVPAPAQIRIYTYTFGPTTTLFSHGGFSLFAHALFGGAHVSPNGCVLSADPPTNAVPADIRALP